MAEIKKISTELQLLDKFLDTSGDAGTSGQILSSTGTGINWVSGGSLPGGPYLPLAGGRITGTNKIEFNNGTQFIQASDGVDLKLGASDDIILETNFVRYLGAVEYARITGGASSWIASPSTSKLGIGTTSPNAKLDVKGDGADFFLQSADYKIARIQPRGTGADLDRGLFSLFNGNTESVRIDTAGNSWLNGGNVGIGTTSPAAKLHVDGNQYIDGDLDIKSPGVGNSITVLQSTSGNAVVNIGESAVGHGFLSLYEVGVGDVIKFDANANSFINRGNVGIGTTSPSQKLEVAGSVAVTGTNVTVANASNPYIYINDTNAGAGIFQQEGNTTRIGSDSNTQVVLVQNNATAVTIDTSKNVGIGTTSPGAKLDVVGKINQTVSSGANSAVFTNSDATNGYGVAIQSEGTANTRYALILRNLDGSDVYGGVSTMTNQVGFWGVGASPTATLGSRLTVGGNASIGTSYTGTAAPSNGMIVQGNVGIGTTSPGAKLQIGSATNAPNANLGNNLLQIKSPSGFAYLTIGNGDVANSTSYIGGASGFTVIGSVTDAGALSEHARVTNTGNVGIGTTSPSTKLEVTGHVTINSPAGASQTSYGLRLRKTNSSSAVQAGGEILASVYPPNTNAANLIFKTANASANLTQRMVIDGIGNVGIGTTSPDSKLHVAGGTRLGGGGCYISTDASFSTNFSYTFRDAVGINNPNSVSAPSVAGYVMSVGRSISGGVGGGIYVEGESRFARGLAGVIKFNAYDGTNNTGSPTHILGTDASGNVVKSTAGSSIGPWLPLAGGTMTGVTQFNDHTNYGDQVYARFGASQDLQIFHNGTDSFIDNYTGSLTIRNRQDDGHIVFTCDDGSGGLASYLTLNGNNTHAYFTNPGNVGIGVTGPVARLDVFGAAVQNGSTPGIKLSSSNTQQTVFAIGNTGTRQYELAVGGTTSSVPGAFYIYDNNAADFRITLATSGNVGIGTTSPGALLDVDGDIRADRFVDRGNPSTYLMDLAGTSKVNHLKVNSVFGTLNFSANNYGYVLEQSTTKANPVTFRFDNDRYRIYSSSGEALTVLRNRNVGIKQTNPTYNLDVTGNGRFTSTVTAANFILSSDERLKENVEKVCDNKVEADWKTFELKTEKGQKRYGVIAQELEKTNPEFVREDSQGFKSVAYIDLLIAKIAELEARLEKLEK